MSDSETLIYDGRSNSWWRPVRYRIPVRNEDRWLTPCLGVALEGCRPSGELRMILEEVSPPPFVSRESVEEVLAAAREFVAKNCAAEFSYPSAFTELAAALSKFDPPEEQKRWRWEGDSIFDGDKEFNIANVEGCTELVAALNANELSEVSK